MGCTASSEAPVPASLPSEVEDGAAPATESRSGSKWALLKGHQATLMSTWLELCGVQTEDPDNVPTLGWALSSLQFAADVGMAKLVYVSDMLHHSLHVPLRRDELMALFEQLGRELSDDEFNTSFERVDVNKDGKIQFGEFLTWYQMQTTSEQKKVRALKVEAELRRRLASGELTPDESRAARSRLALAELVRRLENGQLDEEQAKAVRVRLGVAAALGVPGAKLSRDADNGGLDVIRLA